MNIYTSTVFELESSNYVGEVTIKEIDGKVMAQTEYGDFSLLFYSPGMGILDFLCKINTDYLGKKIFTQWLNAIPFPPTSDQYGEIERDAKFLAEKLLPNLQHKIKKGEYQVYEHVANGDNYKEYLAKKEQKQ